MRRNRVHFRRRRRRVALSFSMFVLLWYTTPPAPSLGASQTEVFNAVWQTVNDSFYDPKFNGIDWNSMRDRYRPQVAQAKSSTEAAIIINRMLSKLGVSHTRLYTADEASYYQALGLAKSWGSFNPGTSQYQRFRTFFPNGKLEYTDIGLFTKIIGDKTFISAILEGSPASAAGLKVGDRLLSVDGNPYQPIQSFIGKADRTVNLSIQRTADPKSQQMIPIRPKKLDPTGLFLEAQQASMRAIERDGRKIGYVHIWTLQGDFCQQQMTTKNLLKRFQSMDRLILDLRDGWGGIASPTLFSRFNSKNPTRVLIARDGKPTVQKISEPQCSNPGASMPLDKTLTAQSDVWNKPLTVLVNEGTRSGKEILAFGLQKHRAATVIGVKTAGAVLSGFPFLMPDGSLLSLAVADLSVDGERLEGKGVVPNIDVPFELEYAQGVDPQLEQALKHNESR
jgi:carboxyl-terminal processing protease